MSNLIVSTSPHIHSPLTTRQIMLSVLLALVPAGVMGVWVFGLPALWVILTCVAACVLAEFIWQRLNGKMPFHLKPRGIACAHKTGEDYDDGITHDVGIIYAEHPILFCFLAEGADVPEAERALQDLALMAADI